MRKNKDLVLKYIKGFTLIELLVVIAIIGILASIVLASLSSARNKGADAVIKGDLANARSQGELYYNIGNTYDLVCTTASTGSGISTILDNAAKQLSGSNTVGTDATAFAYNASGGVGSAVCHDSATGWAAIVSLKAPTTSAIAGWCVDSTGVTREATSLVAGATICP